MEENPMNTPAEQLLAQQTQQQQPQPPRNMLSDGEFNAVSYFAIGISSEGGFGGRDVSNRLSFAGNINGGVMSPIGNSGFSIGTLQTDLGQHPEVARMMVDSYQAWAREQHPEWVLNADQERQTVRDLGRTGEQIRADGGRQMNGTVKAHMDEFLRSDAGIRFVHERDAAQAQVLMDNVYRPLSQMQSFQSLSPDDQVKMATMIGKAYNQGGPGHGNPLIEQLRNDRTPSVAEISASIDRYPEYMRSGRDHALEGANAMIALRNSNTQNPLHNAWQSVVAAGPLTDPTRLREDPNRPNLQSEYNTVKDLFLQKGQVPNFVATMDRNGDLAHIQNFRNRNNEITSDHGMHTSGNNFAIWNRDGRGTALIDGQWRDFDRSQMTRTRNADGSFDLSLNQNGQNVPLLHSDPAVRQRPEPPPVAPQNQQVPVNPTGTTVPTGTTTPTGQEIPSGQNLAPTPSRTGGNDSATGTGQNGLGIDKWSAEQQKVYESVKESLQRHNLPKEDMERLAAQSVLKFTQEKETKPDTRVDRVQSAVLANGDVVVRMEHMKYGDREPIFATDVRLKDTPNLQEIATQIQQANERANNKSNNEQQPTAPQVGQEPPQRDRPRSQ
jgi:hypothetical protein